jgi:tyrosine-protein kinase Etk/Wzc
VRYSRVREMINEDRNTRVNAIEMASRQAEFERATRLKEKGLISRPEFENAEAAYKRQQAMTQDSARSARLRRELDALRSKAVAVETTTPAEESLQQIMITALGIKMERVEHEDKVAGIEEALATARVNLEGLEKLKAKGLRSDEERQALTYDLLALQVPLVKVRALYDVESTAFALVSEATPPVMSAKSTRKLLAVGVAAFVFILGFTLILLKALLTTRIRSGAEFHLAADAAPVGCVPLIKDPGKPDARSQDAYRLLGRALQGAVPGEGARVAVTGLNGDEGVSLVVFRLAELFGLLKGRALVIDVRSARSGHLTLTRQLLPDERPDDGLGTLLKRQKITTDGALAFIIPTALKGVYLLPNDGVAIPTDALGAHGFGALLKALAPRYDIILLDTPPVLDTSTTVFLAEWCDVTLVVARANVSRRADLKHAMERMRITETKTLGVLNAVDPRLDPQ